MDLSVSSSLMESPEKEEVLENIKRFREALREHKP